LRRVADGPQQPPVEEVVAVLADEARGLEGGVVEALLPQRLPQRLAALGGVAEVEVEGGGAVEAAPVDELARDDGLGRVELRGVVGLRRLVGLEDPLALAGRLTGPGAVVDDAELEAGTVGEDLHRLLEVEVLLALEERDD